MKKYKQFLLENVYGNELNYYAFDWDDNILMMNTMVHVDKMVDGEWIPTDVSTADFTDVREHINKWREGKENEWRYRDGDNEKTFVEFRDYGPRGKNAFIEDVISSVRKNNFGPSWDKFIECLVGGHIFVIVTARGHEPESIREAVEWIIYHILSPSQKKEMENNLIEFNTLFGIDSKNKNYNQLVDKYLDLCEFIGLTSNFYRRRYRYEGEMNKPENGKKVVLRDFVKRITEYGKLLNRKVNIGFSDDDKSTVEHMHSFMRNELSLDFPISYHVYYTKDGIKKMPF